MRAEANQFKAVVVGFAIDQNQAFLVATFQIVTKRIFLFSGLGTARLSIDFFQG
jgi:hypothetical protein